MNRFKDVPVDAEAVQPARQRVPVERVRAAQPVPASFGSLAGRAAAPTGEAVNGLAAVYRLELPTAAPATGGGLREMEIAWAGDVARLLVDGRVVDGGRLGPEAGAEEAIIILCVAGRGWVETAGSRTGCSGATFPPVPPAARGEPQCVPGGAEGVAFRPCDCRQVVRFLYDRMPTRQAATNSW